MSISKPAKIWIIVASIPVVLLLGAAVTAKIYFTRDRLKAMLVPRVEQATQRVVTLNDISLSVFPTLAVSMEGLTIANPAKGSFETPAFLSLKELRVNVGIWALLTNKVEVSELILNEPKIYLETTKEGRKNFKFGDSSTTDTVPGTAGGGTQELLFSNIRINDGMIELFNRKFDSRTIIDGLQLTATLKLPPGERNVVVEGTTTIGKFSYGSTSAFYLRDQPVKANLTLTYRMPDDILVFDKVTASVHDLPLNVTGSIANLRQTTFLMDLSVGMPEAQLTQLLSLVPPELLKAAKGLSSTGEMKFAMTVKGPSSETMNPGVRGSFSIADGTIRYASLPKSITGISVHGSFEQPSAPIEKKDIGLFTIEEFSAMLGNDRLGGTMRVANFENPSLTATFTGSLHLGTVGEYYALEAGTELAGMLLANVSLDGKVKTPESMKASGTLSFQNVVVKTAGSAQPLKNLNGTITFNNQAVESKQLAMNIGESDLSLAFSLRNYLGLVMKDTARSAGRPTATVALTSNQLRSADIMPEEPAATSGGKAAQPSAGKQKTGLLPGVDVNASVSINKFVTQKFTCTNVRGAMGVTEGTVTLKNVSMNAFDGSITSKGTLDLRDPARKPFNLELDIKNVASNSILAPFSSLGKNLFGKLSMATKLQGDLNDTLGLNPQTLLGNGSVHIAEGKLEGLPVTQKLSDVTGLNELREVNFKDWANAFAIENGRVMIKDLKVSAGTTSFAVNGSQGLDGSLDYSLNIKLPGTVSDRLKLPGVGDQLLQFFKDKDGRFNLSFGVGGVSSNPTLRLDTRAQEDLAKQAVEQKKQKLLEEGKNKLEEGLKKLLKRP